MANFTFLFEATTPTFFITKPEESKCLPSNLSPSGAICDNLTYLGACGMREAGGVQVAFLSGAKEDSRGLEFDQSGFDILLSRSRASSYSGVDLLLTNHWSRGIVSNLKDISIIGVSTTEMETFGSESVSVLVEALTPRYHFAASPTHAAFERAPYSNEIPNRPVTRFIALSEAFNTRKAKYMYAFNASAMSSLPHQELISVPSGTTPSPFGFIRAELERQQANAKKRKFDDLEAADSKQSSQMFFDPRKAQRGQEYAERQQRQQEQERRYMMQQVLHPGQSPSLPDEHQRQYLDRKQAHYDRMQQEGQRDDNRGGHPHHSFQHPNQPNRPRTEYSKPRFDRSDPRMKQKIHPLMQRQGCWFCLSTPSVEEHLVVSIGDHYYLALAKGGLTPEHLLIVPIEHSTTLEPATADSPSFAELKRFMNALVECYRKKGMGIIFWERKLDTAQAGDKNHAALQALPLPLASFGPVQSGFDSQLEHFGLLFLQLEPDQLVSSVSGTSGYLFADMPIIASSQPSEPTSEETVAVETYTLDPTSRKRFVAITPDKKRVPLQLPRKVIAAALGQPQREDWKACVLTREQEEQACSSVKEDFGPFDFTLQS